ncbi:hypothetical protein [Streptomyces sp. NPDC023588]|uniref:hypothetical protein n=1 Tax=Streptomyces sp. NPDC023588 TaxID=3154907 RepID=UPI0033C4E0CF
MRKIILSGRVTHGLTVGFRPAADAAPADAAPANAGTVADESTRTFGNGVILLRYGRP